MRTNFQEAGCRRRSLPDEDSKEKRLEEKDSITIHNRTSRIYICSMGYLLYCSQSPSEKKNPPNSERRLGNPQNNQMKEKLKGKRKGKKRGKSSHSPPATRPPTTPMPRIRPAPNPLLQPPRRTPRRRRDSLTIPLLFLQNSPPQPPHPRKPTPPLRHGELHALPRLLAQVFTFPQRQSLGPGL